MSTSPAAGIARPAVLSLSINSKSALFAAFMPFIKNGGLFIPTNKGYNLGDEVFMLLQLMDDPAKLPVKGRVVWVTPPNAQAGRTQGVGVQFTDDEAGQQVRVKIEQILGAHIGSNRPTHTI
ncbi:PilZ domain-containing protein [Niveibacterium sp. SC-1]|uniref:PilZ domain-containing protein n=1 Tax=Niveibacterium sp. SC-1 TaxID=3135646 RepID=UPI00311EED61